APPAERGGGPGTEKLHLGAVLGEGVSGDEEAEHGLLAREAVMLVPGEDIGERGSGSGGRGVPPASEQRMLTRLPLLLARLRLGKRDVERGDELGAVAAERVAGARVDQCLDHPLVAEPQVDSVAQVD